MSEPQDSPLIALVGPCTSGKTTLAKRLRADGYHVRTPAQEHSYVADLWRRLYVPDVLIFLDVTIEAARLRRKIQWGQERLDEEAVRLAYAREHADLYLMTAGLSEDEVHQQVLVFLNSVLS